MTTINTLEHALDYFTGVIQADYVAGAVGRGIFNKTYNVGEYTYNPNYYSRTRTNAAEAIMAPKLPIGGNAIAPEALEFTKHTINMVNIFKDWTLNKKEVESAYASGMDLDLLINNDIGMNIAKKEDELVIAGDASLGIDGFTSVSGTTTTTTENDWTDPSTTASDMYNDLVLAVGDLEDATNPHLGPYVLLARGADIRRIKLITDWGYNPQARLSAETRISKIVTSQLVPDDSKIYIIDAAKQNMAMAQGSALQTGQYLDNEFIRESITFQSIGTFFFDPTAINVVDITGP